jgi:hypothetical protein
MNAKEILKVLERLASDQNSVFIPEFTFNDLRVDAVILDPRGRSIRGFEIKVSRSDYLGDGKWQLYSQFCSSLTVICPHGLIQHDEVPKPFGLAWVSDGGSVYYQRGAKQFNRRDLAWTWRYLEVIEKELPRLVAELSRARFDIEIYKRNAIAQEVS